MRLQKHIIFIIGSILLILFLIILFISKNSNNNPPNKQVGANGLFVETDDLLVARQLTEKDLLPNDRPLITFIDPQRGAQEPTLYLVEFSDFSCPFCKDVQITIEQILNTYSDTIRLVWKDAPNQELHPTAMAAHLAARCAQEQNKFWDYHDKLFEQQGNFSKETLLNIAKTVNLNIKNWQTCLDEETGRPKVERGLAEAEVLKIDGTPYFFINDYRISGSITYEELNQVIINELTNK